MSDLARLKARIDDEIEKVTESIGHTRAIEQVLLLRERNDALRRVSGWIVQEMCRNEELPPCVAAERWKENQESSDSLQWTLGDVADDMLEFANGYDVYDTRKLGRERLEIWRTILLRELGDQNEEVS